MPIKNAAKKALRQNKTQKERNLVRKKAMKKSIKEINDLTLKGKSAKDLLPNAYKAIDKAAKRGIIKKNAASRKKSQIAKTAK
ncbi:MAG: 30S ribosomal protein S20 [Candidatus Pacebacteria bacterium]|nr:30S ribosomal protein S20 [Candidatus Paceibacterota bacterium]